ncbi:MAG TPA: sulfatase-like hydrolase/transferase [Polyangiaceae bacterium]|nr:sulfatase-like hydrolase/transferase [Polyangiaceae bacterium]
MSQAQDLRTAAAPHTAPLPRRAARKTVARRRLLARALLLCPVAGVVAGDVALRGERLLALSAFHGLTYALAVIESGLLWGVLLFAASRRRGWAAKLLGGVFVVMSTLALGGQRYFHEQYNAYLNVDVSVFASNFFDSVVNQFWADAPNYAMATLPVFLAATGLVWAARRALRPRRRPAAICGRVAPVLLVASLFIPTQHRQWQASTPDVLYLHAVGGLLRTQLGLTEQSHQLRPKARDSLPIPEVVAEPHPPRNVLFIILESVRADSACVAYDPACQATQYSNALLPDRVPLRQMRALDSSTAISLAVLWAGVVPTASREVLHTWPLIFDYARAAGWDTAFWTSQNLMFGNSRLWVKNLGVRKFCSATELDPAADLDMGAPESLLAERVNREIVELEEPFLAVVQLSNVHYPYYVEPDGPQPFQPATTSKAPENNQEFLNHYRNAVHQQDRHVASIIAALRSQPAGERTVIVYTSDHGEAFREHGQMGHTFSVFDEEVRVPAFVDAPPGTLTDAERAALEGKRDAFTFHVDVAPTLIDLMGLWRRPELEAFRREMPGSSLIRDALTTTPLPMTNCAGVWSCAFENWGIIQGHRKLGARAWDHRYKCFDLLRDPSERHDLGTAACADLLQVAHRTFGRLPGADVPR